MLRPALFALLLAALPAFAEDIAVEVTEELPAGYPPKMGDVWGKLGESARSWETYDFSIGAFDASAWVGAGYEQPKATFHLMAYAPGEPEQMQGRIHAEAEFGDVLHLGEGAEVVVQILKEQDIEGPRLSSDGQTATLVIESIGPARDDSYNRRMTGTIQARLCPVDWEGETCQDLDLRFDTEVQLETSVVVQD